MGVLKQPPPRTSRIGEGSPWGDPSVCPLFEGDDVVPPPPLSSSHRSGTIPSKHGEGPPQAPQSTCASARRLRVMISSHPPPRAAVPPLVGKSPFAGGPLGGGGGTRPGQQGVRW